MYRLHSFSITLLRNKDAQPKAHSIRPSQQIEMYKTPVNDGDFMKEI